MRSFNLADEFLDEGDERALIAAVAAQPALYWELVDTLPAGAFAVEGVCWSAVAAAVEAEQAAGAPPEWTPAPDPQATARRLADLYQRRLLAAAQERLG